MSTFSTISPAELSGNIIQRISRQWALATAEKPDGTANTMTISWGGLGTLWRRPVATVYVKKNRYTFEFMEQNDYFTVSFYPEAQRRALSLLGSTSGRDGDKVAAAGLTPEFLPQGITFRQAETTLVCRKLYCQDFALDQIPQDVQDIFYRDEPVHRMYIGEVVDIIGNESLANRP